MKETFMNFYNLLLNLCGNYKEIDRSKIPSQNLFYKDDFIIKIKKADTNDIKESAENFGFKQPRVCGWIKTNPVPINSKVNYLSNATEYFFTFLKGKKPTFNSEYDNGFYHHPICHGKERYKHPTQKPLSLIKDLISKHSNKGDVILDSFAGTGTTAHACIVLERDFIVIENNIEYYEIIEQRINKLESV